MNRYVYIIARTYEAAERMLEDSLANGDVSWGENPLIEKQGARYVVTLEGY